MGSTPILQSDIGWVEHPTTCSWPTSSRSEPAWSSVSSVYSSGRDSDLTLKLISFVWVHKCAFVCAYVCTLVGVRRFVHIWGQKTILGVFCPSGTLYLSILLFVCLFVSYLIGSLLGLEPAMEAYLAVSWAPESHMFLLASAGIISVHYHMQIAFYMGSGNWTLFLFLGDKYFTNWAVSPASKAHLRFRQTPRNSISKPWRWA